MIHRARHLWLVASALLAVACQEPQPTSSRSPVDVLLPSSQESQRPPSSGPVAPPER